MAELSVEEAQRLARQFLTGAASLADVQRLQADLNDDLSLELLAQIQTALDDVAPAGLTVDQAKSVDSRVEALVVPRIKRSGPFGWLKKLFKGKPADAAPAKRSKFKTTPTSPAPAPVASPPPVPETLPEPSLAEGDGLEDMAPISAAPAEAVVVAPPPIPLAPAKPVADQAKGAGSGKWVVPVLLALLGLALLGALGWWWKHHPKPLPPAPAQAPKLTPGPTPKPTPSSRAPRRGVNVAQPIQEPLPAELPATTPQPAGQLE